MPVRRPLSAAATTALALVLSLAASSPASAARDYHAEQYHTRVVVEPGGSIVVTETVRFVFGPEAFTYVSREVPTRRTDGLTVLEAAMDGIPLTQGSRPGQFEWKRVEDGRRRIVWHFEPTANASRTFAVTYRAAGVAWQDAGSDVLAWRLLPSSHAYVIDRASGEVEVPETASPLGPPELDPPASDVRVEGRRVVFERGPFARNGSWVVTVRFAPRTLAVTPPAWQAQSLRSRAHLPVFLGLAGLILLAGLGGFLFFALSHRPARLSGRDIRVESPPDDLPPALAGALVGLGAAAGWGSLLGALLDLARRGVVRIEAQPPGGVFKQHDARLTKGELPAGLHAHERALLDLLFTDRSGSRSSVRFSQLARAVASSRRWKRLREAVNEDLRAARLIDPDREQTRGRVVGLGVAIVVLAIVGFVLSIAFFEQAGDSVLALPVAALAVGIAGIAIGSTLSPLSDEAQGRAEHWKAFRRHLLTSVRASAGARESAADFERLLPYAAAFGAAVAWAKRLQKQGVTEGPSWLKAASHDGTMGPADFAATVAILSAGSSAGAQAGHSAGGASGAAGGGSSSAG